MSPLIVDRAKPKTRFVFATLLFLLFSGLIVAIGNSEYTSSVRRAVAAPLELVIVNPYSNLSFNYKGNLHAHTTNNGGTETPATVGNWYKDNGYDFYTITDHDRVTADPGIAGILWLGGAEEDTSDGSSGHMGQIGISSPVTTGTDQARIDAVIAQGGFTDLHHPIRVSGGWSAGEIESLDDLTALEIFNGSGDYNSTSIWDTVLTAGKTVWGVASDDSHQVSQHGDGYIVVNSNEAEPTASGIKQQIKVGNFYASRGCDLSVSVTGGTIAAATVNGLGIRWIKEGGAIIKTTTGTSDTYDPVGDEGYVRIEILDGTGAPRAWSQPLLFYQTAGSVDPRAYLAEGYTGAGFYEYICVQNPNITEAYTEISFMKNDGTNINKSYVIPAQSRKTISVNEETRPNLELAALVESDMLVIVERPLYFNYGGWTGGHNVMGAPAPDTTFFFAEGCTGAGFNEYLCIQNPGILPANVTIMYFKDTGELVTRTLTVDANSRKTVTVHEVFSSSNLGGLGPGFSHSTKVVSPQPIVVERPMYFNYGGWTGGHNVMGATSTASKYYFAEGFTGPGFDEYLCLMNPWGDPSTVDITYFKSDGTTVLTKANIPGNSRKTIKVNNPPAATDGGVGANVAHSTKVEVRMGDPEIVAERPMYFNFLGLTGGHNVMGAMTSATTLYFAEGCTNSSFHEYICLMNPDPALTANVTLTYMKEGGGTETRTTTVAANSRSTIYVNDPAQLGSGFSHSTMVTSDIPVIAERPMYFNFLGLTGGHDVVGYMPPGP